MQGGNTKVVGRGGTLTIGVSAMDRDRAFRKARRHTYLVRALRVALPLFAVVSLGYYGVLLASTARLNSKNIAVSSVSVDPTNLTMDNPRYSGFGKDGSEYKVRAKSAVADLRMSQPVRLNTINGEIIQTTGIVTKLSAAWGTYDQKKDLLELYERIDIDGSDGLRARLTRATVLAKESRISSPEPVEAETDTGNIRANAMTLDTKARKAAFRDGVEVTLKNTATTKPTSTPKAEPAQLLGLAANSSEPVVVQSQRLDVDDTAKTALFRDAVIARQGEATLEAPELDVIYVGRAAIGPDAVKPSPDQAGSASAAPALPPEPTRLKWIRARGGVTMTNKGDRAESETLDFNAEDEQVALAGGVKLSQLPERLVVADQALLDQKADTALLTGNVVVTQGRNVLRGGRMMIDRKAGTAKLASPATPSAGVGRIATVFYQAPSTKPAASARSAARDEDAGSDSPFGGLGSSFKSDPNSPIEVEAATLDVNDRKHTAVYAGGVVAKQGTFVVRTEEMTAHYAGETGLAVSAVAAPGAKAGGPGESELRRIEARKNVVVTGAEGEKATGDWATFDVKANTIVMGGNVTVAQGKQLVRANEGRRLVIDLGTGVTRFEAEPGAGQPKTGPQVSGAFATSGAPSPKSAGQEPSGCPPGAVCKSGRLEAIFYPNQFKERVKPGVDAARGAAKSLPDAASSWGAKTIEKSKP